MEIVTLTSEPGSAFSTLEAEITPFVVPAANAFPTMENNIIRLKSSAVTFFIAFSFTYYKCFNP